MRQHFKKVYFSTTGQTGQIIILINEQRPVAWTFT